MDAELCRDTDARVIATVVKQQRVLSPTYFTCYSDLTPLVT